MVLHVSWLLFANVISILQNDAGQVLLLGWPTCEEEVSGRSLVALMCKRNGAVPVLPQLLHLMGQLALSNPSIPGLLNDCFALAGQDWRAGFPSGTILWLQPCEQLGASTFKSCTALPHSAPIFSPDLKQLHPSVSAILTLWVVWDICRSGTCVQWLTWPFTPSSLCLLWKSYVRIYFI